MRYILVLLLLLGATSAQADVWKWVDAHGNTHFVDTMKPIFTWVDETGEVHYSDSPEHESAIAVQLVWVSSGSLADVEPTVSEDASGSGDAFPGETPQQRAERELAEAYYCKRATEIYDSYLNAPRLYKTNEDGEREYLSKEDTARTIAETRAQKDKACRNSGGRS
ncbi:MAG: DUF4124 domain-containing protein [Gammaproteobacteria bacterium]|nr:DUF4124 domain-containing protein [Gammaproteobacteria bacterium]NNF49931.1 DUF4124 domain-containing protein [Woeseiaceae bacterium]MBT8093218.1 DUF4124 domain-containing protein [Gammaproteobacteria bacterium]MBT8106024.1 DUF4124 domain-containing protein [Gammaproteobacteria bacterium]NNK26038.1 DUF4124 domain-containing protein [Woeseiaceae bacterium]